jgi:hypothetical protein
MLLLLHVIEIASKLLSSCRPFALHRQCGFAIDDYL